MKLLKLGSRGFAHHLIIPIIAIFAVGGIGAYVVTRSKAATINYAAMCGTGFTHKRTVNFTKGQLLVYKKGTGNNADYCAFTVRTGTAFGVAGHTSITLIDSETGQRSTKTGTEKYYVGPEKRSNAKNGVSVFGGVGIPNKYFEGNTYVK